jgi:hypothetical protein
MLPSNNIQSIVGATLYGREKAKIGRIDQVLVDAADGHPTWAVLHGGIFGRKNLFVPLDDATWEHDDVFVELDKDDVKNAPHPDAGGGLSPAEEQELRTYYAGGRDALPADADADPNSSQARLATSAERTDAGPDLADDGPKHAAATATGTDAAPAPGPAPASDPEPASGPAPVSDPAPAPAPAPTDRPGPGPIVI